MTHQKTAHYGVTVLLLGMLLLNGCGVDDHVIENLNDGKIQIIGHGGAGFPSLLRPFNPFPHNSMESIRRALLVHEADGVEVDVQMSSDEGLILYHDPTLDSHTALSGCVSEVPASRILGTPYTIGYPFDFFHNERVVSLSALLKLLTKVDNYPFLYLDLKGFNCRGDPDYEKKFAASLRKHLLTHGVPENRLIFMAGSLPMINELKNLELGYSIMYDVGDFELGMSGAIQHQLQGVVIQKERFSASESQEAHRKGLWVVAYGGKSRLGISQAVRKNPDAMQVNNLATLKDLLRR